MEVIGICSKCSKPDVQKTCSTCGQNFCRKCFYKHECNERQTPTIRPVQ